MASTTNANSEERMEEKIRIVFSFCPMILRMPGDAVRMCCRGMRGWQGTTCKRTC